MIEAIEAVLKASDSEASPGLAGEFRPAGRLLSRGDIGVCGLDGGEYFSFGDVADGLHEVYMACGCRDHLVPLRGVTPAGEAERRQLIRTASGSGAR